MLLDGGPPRPVSRTYTIGPSTLVVRFGDLLDSDADVLVSSDDFLLSMGGGVSGAILRAGGHAIAIDAAKAVPRRLGDVVVTGGGALNARYVFHVVTIGPSDHGEASAPVRGDTLAVIRAATTRCLALMDPLAVHSIAFPAIGAGVANLSVEKVAAGMTDAIVQFLIADTSSRRVELHLMAKRWQHDLDYMVFFEEFARRCGTPATLDDGTLLIAEADDDIARQRGRILGIEKERVAIEAQVGAWGFGDSSDLALEYASKTEQLEQAIRELRPTRLFVSYSHDDAADAVAFLNHLAGLKLEGLATWSDREIPPGAQWEDEVSEQLERADVVLFLLSASFISSEYCVGKEWARALERHAAGEVRMIPILLKPCYWRPLVGNFQLLPQDGTALTSHPQIDEAMLDVVNALGTVLREAAAGRALPSG